MRQLSLCVVCVLMVAALCCSQMVEVSQDVYDSAPFDTFKTYSFAPIPKDGAAATPKWRQAESFLVEAINTQMAKKGFTRVDVNPDVYVAHNFGSVDKYTVYADYNVDYSRDYSNAEVWKTGGGVLIIDIVNAKTDRLAWHGIAHVAINVDPTTEMIEKNMNRAVEKILDQYPPKVKKR